MGKKYFTLGFDGSPALDGRLIRLMNDYGLKGTLYLNPRLLRRRDLAGVYSRTELALCAGARNSNETASQSCIERMIEKDLKKMTRLSGKPVLGCSFSSGQPSRETQKFLREKGLLYMRGILSGKGFSFPENSMYTQPTCSHMDKLISIERKVESFLTAEPEDEDLLFLMWGRTYELDYDLREASWEKLEEIFRLAAGRSDIIYCTNAEAFQAHGLAYT